MKYQGGTWVGATTGCAWRRSPCRGGNYNPVSARQQFATRYGCEISVDEPSTSGASAQALDQQPSVIARLDLEIRHCADEVGQAGVAEVARCEARHGFRPLPELRQRCVAFFVALRGLVGGAEDLQQLGVDGPGAGSGLRLLEFLVG